MKIYQESENLIIRSMLESDIDQIATAHQSQGWFFDRSVFESYLNDQELGTRTVFIAEYLGKVAGYVTLVPEATIGPYKEMKLPEIVNFGVFEVYQKNGIGSKLMDAVEVEALTFSQAVTLSVGVHSGYGSAQRMYVKRGYIPDGSGVWYNDRNHEEYADCKNDDTLVLYMMKTLK